MCQSSLYNKYLHESHICSPKGDMSNYLKINIFPLFGNGKVFSENLSSQLASLQYIFSRFFTISRHEIQYGHILLCFI